MSQITRSMPLRGMGRRTSGWAAIGLLVGFGVAVVLTVALAMTAFMPTDARVNNAPAPIEAVDSRLDDYGLRHPNPFGAEAASESRLDDYGLRHPNPFGAVDD